MLDPSPPPIDEVSDKTLHFLGFVAVSFATLGFCRSLREFALAGLLCAATGVMLEFGQALVPSRAFEPGDIVANLSGATVGTLLAVTVFILLQRRWRYA